MRYIIFTLTLLLLGCSKAPQESANQATSHSKISVETTLFPLFDFARTIGGKEASVNLLLPPGSEPHSFEPTPKEVIAIKESDLFIYTGDAMEPWVGNLAGGAKALVVNASTGIHLETPGEENNHHDEKAEENVGEHHHHKQDPHIWTNPIFAAQMVDNILAGFIKVSPKDSALFTQRADSLKNQILALDTAMMIIAHNPCERTTIYSGGHFAFRYFTQRYGLTYRSAYKGLSPSSDPTPKEMVSLIKEIQESGAQYLFFEELVNPRIAQTISKETGAELLLLHGTHNVSKEEMEQGVTYVELMQNNIKNIKKALGCQN